MVISSLSSGGAERVATTLANYWAEQGHLIVIITIDSDTRDFYALNSAIRRLGLDMVGPSKNPLSGLLNNITRTWALRRLLKRESPDIVLGFMPTANVLCGLAAIGTNFIVAGSEHTYPPLNQPTRYWQVLRRLVYPHLAFVSALTDESAEWIETHTGVSHSPVIPNPVAYPLRSHDPQIDPTIVRRGLVAGSYWLLAVGRLTEEKGFDLLIAAFGRLAKDHRDWQLIILGEGPLKSSLLSQAADLGLEARVSLVGAVGNIGEWYKAADAYVLTSRFEGFGNTLAEALAYGLPSIALDCETGPRHILRHGIDGFLVPQRDEQALVLALRRIMVDDRLRHRFGNRASEARERFGVHRVANIWLDLFEKIACEKI